MILKSCVLLLCFYGFALLCGSFSTIFMPPSSFSVGILARNSIVGLCAFSIPVAVIAAMVYGLGCNADDSLDAFLITLAITSSIASGLGAAMFHMKDAGARIIACLFSGLAFGIAGFFLYSVAVECICKETQDEGDVEQSLSRSENGIISDETTTANYRVVEQPCGDIIQLAVKT